MERFTKYIDPKVTVGNLLTIVAMLVGGIWFMATTDNRIKDVEDRVAKLDRAIETGAAAIIVKDERSTQKIEAITRDITDLKVTVGRVDEAVRFLVQQERRRPLQ